MADSEFGVFFNIFNRVFMGVVTCIVSLGGAVVGIITGAIKGPATETGLVRGAAVGAVTGAITALQLMDMMANGEPFSKVSLLCSLVNGQIVTEWVAPAVLKAYQWQVDEDETSFIDIFEGFESNESKGLCEDSIKKLPSCMLNIGESKCAICLQSFQKNEEGRELPGCRHTFHLKCIDVWLMRNASCPICRKDV